MQPLISLQSSFNSFLINHFDLSEEQTKMMLLNINASANRSSFGDLSSSIALHIAQKTGKSSYEIGTFIATHFINSSITKIECAGAGFINIFLAKEFFIQCAQEIFITKEASFTSFIGCKKKILIEFVSANPTGPLHFGHGRNGIIGDVLGNVLKFLGHSVTKEFYVNDAGKQIQKLATSLIIRCQQRIGINAEIPQDGYQGDYLIAIADECINEYGIKVLENPESFFAEYAKEKIINSIKKTLELYRIQFDNWFFESKLHEHDNIEKIINLLIKKQLIYEKDGALWFASTEFNDDKDRVVRKNNGELTYLASDIAYLKNKSDRGYQKLIMVLGQDHHSFAIRLHAIQKALDLNCSLDIILYQLVHIKEGEQNFKMSKRSGHMLFLADVINLVGTDTARFFYSNRKADAQLEFNLELALQKTDANPFFYIQYAYVRIQSILKKSVEIQELRSIESKDALFLKESEIPLLKKIILLQKVLEQINETLQPHTLSFYVIELAQSFHAYYTEYKIIDFDNIAISRARLLLLSLVKNNISLCLDLIGISKPEKM